MRRKKNNLNKVLTSVILVMTSVLIVLIAITYIDTNIINRNPESNSSNAPSDNNTSADNNASEDVIGDDTEDVIRDSSDHMQEDTNENVGSPGDDIEKVEDSLPEEPIVLTFAGDVNLDEDSKPVARYDRENKKILGGISQDLVDEMN
ncbi:MAG: hypothetical protein PHC56_07175, partial [Herbinix sp.]|nr:hypothetical protein [Herbinix sp.]